MLQEGSLGLVPILIDELLEILIRCRATLRSFLEP